MRLSNLDHDRVTAAVRAAERDTDGEIVTIVAAGSDPYHDVSLHYAVLAMLLALFVQVGTGLFSNNDTLADRLLAAGKATGEAVWRMPLGEAYDKLIRSDVADMKNIGGRPGGAIIGAQFIQRFVRGPWAHLDIAGTAWATKDSATTPKGATAFGVRLLDRLVADHYEA